MESCNATYHVDKEHSPNVLISSHEMNSPHTEKIQTFIDTALSDKQS